VAGSTPAPLYAAIEIGGTKLQIAIGTAEGVFRERVRFAIRPQDGAEGIRQTIARELPPRVAQWQPVAVGVGFGGPLDWREGRIAHSFHVPGWGGFPLAAWLERLCGVLAYIENDGNVAAFGEAHLGAGRGCDPVFYVTVGSGVGGGLVAGGRLYHGRSPGEAEIGHLRLDLEGSTPESTCSGWSLDRLVRRKLAAQPDATGELARRVRDAGEGGEARHLGPAWQAGDPLAEAVLREGARNLAHALSHVVHLFHPEVIVLGGGVSLLGEPWRAAVADALRGMMMPAFGAGPRVVLAGLGEAVVPAGALALAAARHAERSRPTLRDFMHTWFKDYIASQHKALDSLPIDALLRLTQTIRGAWLRDAQIFVAGNGGNAANASHFATDLGKGASDLLKQRFRVLSLNDNTAWVTALGNDYSYDDVFLRQLQNYARAGDVFIVSSVSGNSPNLVKAAEWANGAGLETIALVGAKRGRLAELARQTIVIEDAHYGRVEDVQMHILHMLCYALMENPALAKAPDAAAAAT
jgi:predicted NBD/HSP70 family sugar kinase